MSYRVIVQPEAEAQAVELDIWWRANRPESRASVLEELGKLEDELAEFPNRFARYRDRDVRMRRLRGTPYLALYHVLEDAKEVHIVSVWSSVRGDEPPL